MAPRRKRTTGKLSSSGMSEEEIKTIMNKVNQEADKLISSLERKLKEDLERRRHEINCELAKIPLTLQNMTIGELAKKGYFDPPANSASNGNDDTLLVEEFQPAFNSTAVRPENAVRSVLGRTLRIPKSVQTNKALSKFTTPLSSLTVTRPLITPKPLPPRLLKPGEVLYSVDGSPVHVNFKVPGRRH